MIRYYNGDMFIGYAVGRCPMTGIMVLVDNKLNYIIDYTFTRTVVGEDILDERTKPEVRKCDKTPSASGLPHFIVSQQPDGETFDRDQAMIF